MKHNIIRKSLPLSLLLAMTLLFSPVFAQFRYKSEIPPVAADGYYHIQLPPEALALSSRHFSDVRIKDADGNEIPYIVRAETPQEESVSFINFKLLQNDFIRPDSVNRIVIDNEEKHFLQQFYFVLRTADIQKYIMVRGSDDGKKWYMVMQRKPAPVSVAGDNASEAIVVDFPRGNYRYYEIRIDNPQREPLNILSAGRYKYSEIYGKYMEIPVAGFAQQDSSNKKTYIRFSTLENGCFADKLCMKVGGNGQDYYRTVRILQYREEQHRKNGRETSVCVPYETGRFVLSSKGRDCVSMGSVVDQHTVLEIENNDNPPLKIEQVTVFQLNRYLTAYLTASKTYTLFFGNAALRRPAYDIVHFDKDIPQHLPLLTTGELVTLPLELMPEKKLSFYERPVFLWLVIGGVGLLLLLMCYRMVRRR